MSRTSLLASAFAENPITVAGKTLRPPTAGSIMLLMKTGNLLFSEKDDSASDEGDILQAMLEFMWVHTEDKTLVVRTCQHPDKLHEAAALMGMDLSFEDLSQLSQQFDAMQKSMSASLVDVVQEPGEKKAPRGDAHPHWLATLIFSLGGAGDPVREHYILWDLPFARALQYVHASHVHNGARTRWKVAHLGGPAVSSGSGRGQRDPHLLMRDVRAHFAAGTHYPEDG